MATAHTVRVHYSVQPSGVYEDTVLRHSAKNQCNLTLNPPVKLWGVAQLYYISLYLVFTLCQHNSPLDEVWELDLLYWTDI